MKPGRLLFSLLLVLPLIPDRAAAATFVVPSDRILVRRAEAIVVGRVVASWPGLDSSGEIQTVTEFAVEETLRGTTGRTLRVVHWGGAIGDRWMVESGAPVYVAGEEILLFLIRDRRGEWTTLDLTLGRFALTWDLRGRLLALRDEDAIAGWDEEGSVHRERVRLALPFLQFIRDISGGERAAADYWAAADALPAPVVGGTRFIAPDYIGSQYVKLLGGYPGRRNPPTTAFRLSGNQTGLDSDASATVGTGSWTNDASSNVNYTKSGTAATGDVKDVFDGEDRIIANDPHGDISGTFTGSGTVATAFYGGNAGTHTYNGETWYGITGSDVVVQDGVSGTNFTQEKFNTTITHEVGHTLGFRHSNKTEDNSANCSAPLPCSSTAIMNSSVVAGLNGVLQPWDIDAVRTVYATCSVAGITTHPASQTIDSGNSADLSITATGTGLSYQWFQGQRTDTTDPVGTDSSSFNTGALTSTTTYWVRVTNSCGENYSNAATITVNACDAPVITAHPASQTIPTGTSANLSVTASGAGLSYQWYQGTAPSTGNPVGTSSSSYDTGNLASTTSYWVRVSNSCGDDDSNTATITVCTPPSVTSHPASTTIPSGTTTILSVTASGAGLSYQWYRGTAPSTTNPVGTNSSSFTTPALTSTTSYWVRVSNGCGTPADSNTATVTVCVPPSISAQPASQTIPTGTTANLSVTATAATSYQWYQGTSGNTGTPVGTNSPSYTTPVLSSTTSYWVRVTNGCGPTDSNTATVTVCTLPAITSQPQSQTIPSGTTANLNVTATGATSYQWYQGPSGNTGTPVGTNSPSYNTPPLVSNTNYWVRVTNACGSADSGTAAITVCTLPSITTHPASQTVTSGNAAALSVTATGATSYQWYQGNSGTTTTPVGTSSASFTTPPLTSSTNYWVRATNACGSVDSNTAVVTVCTPPSISAHPASTTISSGSSTVLSVTAAGTTLSYQWYRGTAPDTSDSVGTNSASYNTGGLNSTTSYWVRVSGQCGSAVNSNTATVTVCTPPSISAHPSSQTITSGNSASLSVAATGTGLSYQWYRGTKPDTGNPVGTNSASYDTGALTSNTSYWVRVSGSCGAVDSNTATITVCTPPAITTHPAGQTVASGTAASLSVAATGSTLSYQWYRGTKPDTSAPVGTNSPSFNTPSLTVTTSYWVRVSNGCGTLDSNTAVICVLPGITTHPASQTITSGTSTVLSVSANGSGLSYQWYLGAAPSTAIPVGTNSPTHDTGSLTATTSYWVRVTNSCGTTDSNTAVVTVSSCSSPAITGQPQSLGITSGQSTVLTVAASSESAMSYQWYQGAGTATPVGTNSPSYNTGALTSTTIYWVRVTNSCGSTDSGTATVTVCTPPSIATHPASQSIDSGSSAVLSVAATGTALSYQWYRGTRPDTGHPVGNNSPSYDTGTLTSTTSYWVRVTGTCGTSDSNTATVTVSCPLPEITAQPQSVSIISGQQAALAVAASSTTPIAYQWFRGTAPDTSTPVGTNSAVMNTGALTSNASYWVRLTNGCGSVDSSTATVTVASACTAPVITEHPVKAAVSRGAQAVLQVAVTGTSPLTFQWYEGERGDVSKPAGSISWQFTTPPLQAPTRYWVLVSNACGSAQSESAEVTVGSPRRRAVRR